MGVEGVGSERLFFLDGLGRGSFSCTILRVSIFSGGGSAVITNNLPLLATTQTNFVSQKYSEYS